MKIKIAECDALESELRSTRAALERVSLVAVTFFAAHRELRMDTPEDEALREELLDLARKVIPSIDSLADNMKHDGRDLLAALDPIPTSEERPEP